MVDFIRLVYDDKVDIEEFILMKENFEKLYTILEYHSGEILYPYRTSLENMDVAVNDKVVIVKNSIHKLHNLLQGNGEQNYNDFTYSQLCKTIDFLQSKLIGIDSTKITMLEFGLNIYTPMPAEIIVRENIIGHKEKQYSHNLKFRGKGEYLQFDYNDFYIKVYDKAKQNSLNSNILRFEVKFIRRRGFNRLGIFTLSDLKVIDNLNRLFTYLLGRFDEMVIVDDFTHLSDDDKNTLINYLSKRYWIDIDKKYSRQTKLKYKLKFKAFLEEHDLLNTKTELRNELVSKYTFLIDN